MPKGVTSPGVAEMVAAEHADLCALAQSLGAVQWEAPTLCDGWTVRDVMIHLADHVHRTGGEAFRATVRGGLSPTKSARLTVERHRDRSTADLLSWLGTPVRSPSPVQLAELVIHQQDVRRPLGLDREIPEDRVVACLDFALSRTGNVAVAGARRRAAGIRLTATDTPWSWGAGPEVRGPAEALLMAVNGRPEAVKDLSGDGIATLAERCRS